MARTRPDPRAILAAAAKRRRWSVVQLAAELGISLTGIYRVGSRKVDPHGDVLKRLLQGLAVIDADAAKQLADAYGVDGDRIVPSAVPVDHVQSTSVQVYVASEMLDVPPAKLRAALLRVLDSAIAQGRTLAEVRDELVQLTQAVAQPKGG